MNSAKRPILARIAACTALALLVTATMPALADASHQPVITEVRPEGALLHIVGFNFGGGTPAVTLGGLPLALAFTTATSIRATLPAMAPGTYLLTLAIDSGAASRRVNDDGSKYDEFWVTIGAVGPQGPAGLDGVDGATGAVGPQGPAGPIGATGAQGPAGPIGRDGATGQAGGRGDPGPQGLQGLAGAMGAQGFPGPQGPAGSSLRTMVSSDFTVPTASWGTGQIQCPANFPQLVSAGAYPHAAPVTPASGNFAYEPPGTVMYSWPSGTGGWRVTARNETGRPFNAMTVTFTIVAVCSN